MNAYAKRVSCGSTRLAAAAGREALAGVLPLWALRRLLPLGGLAGPLSSCRFLGGQAVLQAGVAELVDRPDRAQDATAAGVFEEPHKADRSPVRCSELYKREGG